MEDRIRFGVILDSANIPAWQHHLLDLLSTSQFTVLDTVFLRQAREPAHAFHGSRYFLYNAFRRRDASSQPLQRDACAVRNVSDDIEVAKWRLLSLPPGDAGAVRRVLTAGTYNFDVLLVLGSVAGIASLDGLSRWGTWYFRHSYCEASSPDGSAAGFWEVIKRLPCIHTSLMGRTGDGAADRTLYESWSGVNHKSHAGCRNELLWKIPYFVLRAAERVYRTGEQGGPDGLFESSVRETAVARPPTNLRVLLPMIMYMLWRLKLKAMRKIYDERWILMFSLPGDVRDVSAYRKIIPPEGRFWADPHLVRRDDTWFIFMEDASLETWHGHLSVIRLEADGEYSEPTEVIAQPYHLSYPFILEWEDELYLIPESADNRTVEVYRCKNFPERWELSHRLMENICAYDATLFEQDGTWWLFANVRAHEGASTWDELCLFYADHPLSSDWQAHPLNPVISDVRSARPAGPVFRRDGRLFRPSQNSSNHYGYGLNFNEIEEITRTSYREKTVSTIKPDRYRALRGVHTYAAADDLIVIDALYRARKRSRKTAGPGVAERS